MPDMFHNLKTIRKKNGLTIEAVAEKIGVSRQAVAKWEKGESVPDISNCIALAELYDVTIDSLVRTAEKKGIKANIQPNGKHIFGLVRVNDKGQITLPKYARTVFNLKAGDFLLVLGDEAEGIAMVKMGGKAELPVEISAFNNNEEGE